jgi:serine/threonine-protein kinase
LLAAERIDDKTRREAKKREIEQALRDPALAYLAASQDAEVPSKAYVAALVAFYEGRFDEALKQLDTIGGGLPWFYEAPELRGDIFLARAWSLRNRGEGERARLDFEVGRQAYASAAAVGRSVPLVYKSLGDLEYAVMVLELYGHGDVMPSLNRALAATAQALAVEPEHYEALVLEASVQRSLAEYQANRGKSVEDVLAKARADAERAVALSPLRPQARVELARIYRQWGEARQGRSQDPSEQLRKAIEVSQAIDDQHRDATYYNNLGVIFKIWADYQDDVGVDAQENRRQAIDAYSIALKFSDHQADVWTNISVNSFKKAAGAHAKDPDGDLQQALRALDHARGINAENVVMYFNGGRIYRRIAQRALARGDDPGPDLDRALAQYRHGLTISPKLPHLHNGLGDILMDQAKAAWDRGTNPEPLLEQARAAFDQAITEAPDQGFGYDNVGEVLTLRAWLQRARGEDPATHVQGAVEALKLAIKKLPGRADFWADLGMAHALLAGYELEHGHDPQPSLAQASTALRDALERNPADAQANFALGETNRTLAQLHARQGHGKPEEFEAAAQAYHKAIDLAPENQDYRLGLIQHHLARAGYQLDAEPAPDAPLKRGLELANQALARRPGWPDARVLRASLLLMQAQRSQGEERHLLATNATLDFSAALAVNPVLAKLWSGQASLATQIAAAR